MSNIIFMGTPEFAVPSLQALAHSSQHRLVGVVTRPDQPSGRGRTQTPSPVKRAALELGLSLIQPARLRDPQSMARLLDWSPDLIVVAAFGQILKPEVLELPAHGCLNVHASLLPRHRGAAPIPAAILAGDPETGVTIMKIDAGLDTGPILSSRSFPILPDDTTGSLTVRLAALGAGLLLETLPPYLAGELRPFPQDSSLATYAGQLRKEHGKLDFSLPAYDLSRRVRAFYPWPGAFALWHGQPLKILRATSSPGTPATPPGTVLDFDSLPGVVSSEGVLLLEVVQPPGKKPMSGADFSRGVRGFIGTVLV